MAGIPKTPAPAKAPDGRSPAEKERSAAAAKIYEGSMGAGADSGVRWDRGAAGKAAEAYPLTARQRAEREAQEREHDLRTPVTEAEAGVVRAWLAEQARLRAMYPTQLEEIDARKPPAHVQRIITRAERRRAEGLG